MRTTHSLVVMSLIACALASTPAIAEQPGPQTFIEPGGISAVRPVSGPWARVTDPRIDTTPEEGLRTSGGGFSWNIVLQNNRVITAISMVDAHMGYASGERGTVFKTTNGLDWAEVMFLDFPYYWYGIKAFDPDTVFISGFDNQAYEGLARWSTDGAATWTADLLLSPGRLLWDTEWADREHGIIAKVAAGVVLRTETGGADLADWEEVIADSSENTLYGSFTFMPSGHVFITGGYFARSTDFGETWATSILIDPTGTQTVSFPTLQTGFAGGGLISAPQAGWVYRSLDGGDTWMKVLDSPWAIREVLFLDESIGFAAGGNHFSNIGGIWSTVDGGDSWNLDVIGGYEMQALDWARINQDSVAVWCGGFGSLPPSGQQDSQGSEINGRIYRTQLYLPEATVGVPSPAPRHGGFRFVRAAPNPFHASTSVVLDVNEPRDVRLTILDAAGRRVRELDAGRLSVGRHTVRWDGRDANGAPAAAGIYHVVSRDAEDPSLRVVLLR